MIRASSITVSRSIEKATFPPATFENVGYSLCKDNSFHQIKRRLTLSESNYGNSELLQLKQPVLDIHCADVDSHGLHSFIMVNIMNLSKIFDYRSGATIIVW